MSQTEMTYAQALARLEEIVEKLGSGDVGVDELGTAVAEGVKLVAFCRQRLRSVQEDVDSALTGLIEDGAATVAPQSAP